MARNRYFDKNKDYSLEIVKAQERGASQAELAQLRWERQNKIDSVYGGADPYQGKRDVMGWGGSRPGHPAPDRPREERYGLQSGRGYENKRFKLGDWTYIYNENGRSIGRVKDYGASANATLHTTHANDSPGHLAAYAAANRGDWDAVGHWIGKISESTPDGRGSYDMAEANAYLEELQLEFPKGTSNFYRDKYDRIYGPGAWDDPNHSAANPYVDEAYRQAAEQNRESGALLPQRPLGSLPGYRPAGSGGLPNGSVPEGYLPGGYDRAELTLQELYRRKAEAERSRLRAMYEEQAGGLRAQDDLLERLYADKRNQAAAQNEQERLRLAELGLAQGLNTGAEGQIFSGQSGVYQGVLGKLDRQELTERAENARKQDALWTRYLSQLEASNARHADQYYAALEREEERLRREAEARRRADAEAERLFWDQQRRERDWEAHQAAEQWKQDLKRAEIMAGWGDYSGYRELGLIPDGAPDPRPLKKRR